MRIIILLSLIFTFSLHLTAQEVVDFEAPQKSLKIHLQAVNGTFPGAELAYEFPLLRKTQTNQKRYYQINIGPQVEYYRHSGFHSGLVIGADTKWLTQGHKGFEYFVFGGAGLLQTILIGEVYEQTENGTFEKSKYKGNRHLQLKAGLGFGFNAWQKHNKPYALNTRIGIRQQHLPGSPLVFTLSGGINYYFTKKAKS